jgi:hypothetical protein
MATVIVIPTVKSKVKKFSQGNHTYSYHLTTPLEFKEPHYARHLYVGSADKTQFVFVDFVVPQRVNDELLPYLGCSAKQGNTNPWLPVASTSIPSVGYFTLKPTDSKNLLATTSKQSIVIQIASESWLNGTSGKAKL